MLMLKGGWGADADAAVGQQCRRVGGMPTVDRCQPHRHPSHREAKDGATGANNQYAAVLEHRAAEVASHTWRVGVWVPKVGVWLGRML